MDIAALGLKVDSTDVKASVVDLRHLTGAAGHAATAARQLAGASQAEAAGQKAATAATMAHTAALNAQNIAMRVTNQQRTMMIYQLNDVAVSLASGMNPMMVAMQQGSQILQGGFMPAIRTMGDLLRGLVTRFWPVAVAIGTVTAALAGLTYEFNKTGEVQVSMMDVAIAGWQMFSETVTNLVAPLFSQIGQWLEDGWNAAAPVLKTAGNAIIGAFVGAYDAVKATWSLLPSALGDLVIQAVNGVIGALEQMLQRVTDSVNGFIRSINGAIMMIPEDLRGGWTGIGEIGDANVPRAGNPYAGAAANAKDAATGAFMGAQRDYLGGLGGAWDARAEQIALARQEMDELGGSTKAANDNAKALGATLSDAARTAQQEWEFYRSTFSGFFSDLKSGLKDGKSFWESFGQAASNALDSIADRLLGMASNGLFDMLFGGLFGGIGNSLGGGWGVAGGFSGFSGIFGIPGMAKGGTVGQEGLSWVGEKGPELLRLPQGAQVIPNGPSMAMAANQNSGDITIINQINVPAGTSADVAPAIAREVTKELRRQLPDAIDRHNRNPLRRAA